MKSATLAGEARREDVERLLSDVERYLAVGRRLPRRRTRASLRGRRAADATARRLLPGHV